MQIIKVIEVFIDIVEYLISYRTPEGISIYFESKNSMYINFKPISFRKRLRLVVGSAQEKRYLEIFRTLEFIKVDCKDRYTNIQWLHQRGGSVRVICVDKEKFILLKELIKEG